MTDTSEASLDALEAEEEAEKALANTEETIDPDVIATIRTMSKEDMAEGDDWHPSFLLQPCIGGRGSF